MIDVESSYHVLPRPRNTAASLSSSSTESFLDESQEPHSDTLRLDSGGRHDPRPKPRVEAFTFSLCDLQGTLGSIGRFAKQKAGGATWILVDCSR